MRAAVTTEKEAWLKVWYKHMQAIVIGEAEKMQLIRENSKICKKDLPLKPCATWKATQGSGNSAGPSKGPRTFNGPEGILRKVLRRIMISTTG